MTYCAAGMALPRVSAAWGFEMIVLLAGGVVVCMVGLLAIGFGVPISDTSFGNALLIAGVVIMCTGLILIGMWAVARELSKLARLAPEQSVASEPPVVSPADPAPNPFGFPIGDPAAERPSAGSGPPPWATTARARAPSAPEVPPIEPVEAPPPPAPDRPARRNLLFASRRRDRTETLTVPPLPATPDAEPKVSFEHAWTAPVRPNDARERTEPAAPSETDAGTPHQSEPPTEAAGEGSADLPEGVTVVRSGTVDEMSYTYYSDGSIEAQLPGEGPIRFPSLDALRAYVEQRK